MKHPFQLYKHKILAAPWAWVLLVFLFACDIQAQDTLPNFTARKIGKKNIISWSNTYGARIANINIQRSIDSLRNFSSIGSVLDPNNSENGFVDPKAPDGKVYYRVFVAFEGGSYLFSKSKRPYLDTVKKQDIPMIVHDTPLAMPVPPPPPAVTQGTKDPPPPAPKLWVASKFIFTGRDNNVQIQLPDALKTKYRVKFYNDQDQLLFEVKIKEPQLVIEKVNFLRSGWFYFQLYEQDILIERNKFYIPKEGKYGIPPNDPGRYIQQ